MKTAYATIKGFEVMRTLKKKQAKAFLPLDRIGGEVRFVERAFGIGLEMINELMSLHGEELQQIAIERGFL
jgi:IS6 family transposase